MTGGTRDEDRRVVLEVYKVAVEMADRVSARRSVANNFYLTIHSAFVAGILVAVTGREQIIAPTGAILICLAAAGIALALLWRRSLVDYQQLTPKVPSFEQARHPLAGSLFVDGEEKGSDTFRVVGTNGLWDLVMSL